MGFEMDKGPVLTMQERGVVNADAALPEVMAYLISETQLTFKEQGWQRHGGTAWPPRMVPNIPGIIRDLQEGSTTLKKRRLDDRPALVDTGRLRGSIDGRYNIEAGTVTVGTNAPGASKQHRGGPSVFAGAGKGSQDPQLRPRLAAFLRRNPTLKADLGWLFGVDEVTVNVRPRPIVEAAPGLVEGVKDIITSHAGV